ncbi:MAG: hypothetical protein ACM3TR_19940 [Caulobacteraceae bacterium]
MKFLKYMFLCLALFLSGCGSQPSTTVPTTPTGPGKLIMEITPYENFIANWGILIVGTSSDGYQVNQRKSFEQKEGNFTAEMSTIPPGTYQVICSATVTSINDMIVERFFDNAITIKAGSPTVINFSPRNLQHGVFMYRGKGIKFLKNGCQYTDNKVDADLYMEIVGTKIRLGSDRTDSISKVSDFTINLYSLDDYQNKRTFDSISQISIASAQNYNQFYERQFWSELNGTYIVKTRDGGYARVMIFYNNSWSVYWNYIEPGKTEFPW